MNKTQQLSDKDFAEAGAADALFDDEATVLAQPVVPLAGSASDAPEEMTVVAAPAASDAPGVFNAARRPTLLALALVSALVGAFIGGTALYLFQRGRTAPAQTTAPAPPQSAEATTTTAAPVENQQPAPQNSEQQQPPAPQAQDMQPAPDAETRPAAVQGRQPEAERRREHEGDDDRADDRRRGRGRGRDDEGDGEERYAPLEQAVERPRRRDGAIDTQAPILDDASPASRRAARVEEALRRIEDNRRARRARRVGVIH